MVAGSAFFSGQVAFPAGTTTPDDKIGVLGRELMAVRAMGLGRILSRKPIPAQEILAPSDGFEVGRVATGAIPAEMVNLHSLGDRAHEMLVGQSMDADVLVLGADPYLEASVAVPEQGAGPRPAPVA